jgi:hypothetical protein
MSAVPSSAQNTAAERLAAVLVDGILAQPLSALAAPVRLGPMLRELLLFHLCSPAAEASSRAVLSAVQRFFGERGDKALRDLISTETAALLRALLAHPYTPERAILVAIFSREPFRRWNRELMMGTMLDYSRRLRTTVEGGGMGKGLGVLGRFASEAVKKSTSALGSLAPGVTSAVSDEFERQMQRRAAEFADSAVDDMVQRLSTTLTDPARATEQLELKQAMFDTVLSLRGAQVARELERLQPMIVADKLRQAALTWLSRDTATAELTAGLTWLLAQPFVKLPPTLPDALHSALTAVLAQALRPMVESGAVARAVSE